jgi:hypothetical protein
MQAWMAPILLEPERITEQALSQQKDTPVVGACVNVKRG